MHPDMHRLSTQQHVSLDKHRNMVNSALRWQQHSPASQEANEQHPATVAHLRLAFATILNIFIK